MPRKPPSARQRFRADGVPPTAGTLWVGGRFALPAYVQEGEPYRPEAVMWLDAEHDLIRSFRLERPPLERSAIAASLEQAIVAPMAGPPGEPRRLRVAEAELAAIARHVLSPDVEVEVGPVDELTAAVELLGRAIAAGPPPASDEEDERPAPQGGARGRAKRRAAARGDEGDGYLCDGRIAPELVASLFDGAARLVAAAPWRRMSDDVIFAVDAPALGLSGACLSVIGALGENLGFLLFDSIASFEGFLALDESRVGDRRAPLRVPGNLLSLSFVRWSELPAPMRREARAHGWSVSDPRGYPELMCIDPDGVPRPHAERDYRVAAACASALAGFCATYDGDLEPPPYPPASRKIATAVDGQRADVTLTLPHPGAARRASITEAVPPAPPARRQEMPRVGRNDPCPCGSGRKFKRCHGDAVAANRAADSVLDQRAERALRWHERDRRLLDEILEFAKLRFGESLRDVADTAHRLSDEPGSDQVLAHWIVHHAQLGERSLVDHFLATRGDYLTRADRDWLVAGRAAWMSIWEVIDVTPGRSMELRDLLTGEQRTVVESNASRQLARFDAVLGRVVDIEDLSLLCGAHTRILQPRPADAAVRAVRRRVRLGAKLVAVERLRSAAAAEACIAAWVRTVASETRRAEDREIRNGDGHRILLTTDRFRFAPARRDEVVAHLAALAEHATAATAAAGRDASLTVDASAAGGPGGATIHLRISRPSTGARSGLEAVLLGELAIHRDLVVAETNSRERADEVREMIERCCAGLVEHAGRAHSDSLSSAVRGDLVGRMAQRADESESAEAMAAVLEMKKRHYAGWMDSPLPKLDGRTPREASRSAGGRREVALMLREIENIEARSPEAARFDASMLWRELGIRRTR